MILNNWKSIPTVIRFFPVFSVLHSGGLVRDAFRIDSAFRIVVAVLTVVILIIVDLVVVVQVAIVNLVSRSWKKNFKFIFYKNSFLMFFNKLFWKFSLREMFVYPFPPTRPSVCIYERWKHFYLKAKRHTANHTKWAEMWWTETVEVVVVVVDDDGVGGEVGDGGGKTTNRWWTTGEGHLGLRELSVTEYFGLKCLKRNFQFPNHFRHFWIVLFTLHVSVLKTIIFW